MAQQAPKAKAKAANQPPFDTVEVLERLDTNDDKVARLTRGIKEVQDTNRLILLVLFLGFIAIMITVIIFIATTILSDKASRDDLSNQVRYLNERLRVDDPSY